MKNTRMNDKDAVAMTVESKGLLSTESTLWIAGAMIIVSALLILSIWP